MGGPPNSQVAPLPKGLPFRLVSKTIGSGAYASIRKAVPLTASSPVIAVKFINKEHAFRAGRLQFKHLKIEASLHHSVREHTNIITFVNWGHDEQWVWMCLELAEGGDLFDKIEADEGVGEDVAHFYFTQLVGAVKWCHKHGVAHRDIKPENMLLSGAGDLRLADFGLATQFRLGDGSRKTNTMVCGSPPYIAPEILAVGARIAAARKQAGRDSKPDDAGYDPQMADVWSCAIVLFVLLVGNTPWDSPVAAESYEFYEYVRTNGQPDDELWQRVPPAALGLLHGMLNTAAADRLSLDDVRKQPWFTRPNPHLNSKGLAANPVGLATQMLESLHIDFSAPPPPSSLPSQSQQQQRHSHTQSQLPRDPPADAADAMDLDPSPHARTALASTQPETPIADLAFDWEAPPRVVGGGSSGGGGMGLSASQPAGRAAASQQQHVQDLLADDPSMSQFAATPAVPLTLTQAARRFADIVPAHSLARFVSALRPAQLLPMLAAALHRLDVAVLAPPAPPSSLEAGGGGDAGAASGAGVEPADHGHGGDAAMMDDGDGENDYDSSSSALQDAPGGGGAGHASSGSVVASWRIKTVDARAQPLQGSIVVERVPVPGQADFEVLEVRFVKAKGDPLGWRRLFKHVAVLCKDGVVVPQ